VIELSISELVPRFPGFRVAMVVADGLALRSERPPALDALILEREQACRERWAASELSEIPGIAAWRAAYKGFGIKKTSYRSSVERLVKRVKAGERLPAVNTLVDIFRLPVTRPCRGDGQPTRKKRLRHSSYKDMFMSHSN
jgi:DNA/RNA-binding domain of Phe-tRNA-synthetase-like protein